MTLRIFGGSLKGRVLKAPPVHTTRPTQGVVREALFNICQNRISNCRFLDLFAGSGAMGLEAISRGAQFATFIENGKAAVKCLRENIRLLKVEPQTQIISQNVLSGLSSLMSPFDIVYIDPPYSISSDPLLKIFEALEKNDLLSTGAIVFLESLRENPPLPYSSPKLHLTKSRQFGTTGLYQFEET